QRRRGRRAARQAHKIAPRMMRHIPFPLSLSNSNSRISKPFEGRLADSRKGAVPSRPPHFAYDKLDAARYRCTWYCEDEITRYSAVFAWFFVFDPAEFIAVNTVCFIWLDIVPCNILLFSQSTIASWEPALYTGVKSSLVPLLIELFTIEFT